jgi:hypothetical protein
MALFHFRPSFSLQEAHRFPRHRRFREPQGVDQYQHLTCLEGPQRKPPNVVQRRLAHQTFLRSNSGSWRARHVPLAQITFRRDLYNIKEVRANLLKVMERQVLQMEQNQHHHLMVTVYYHNRPVSVSLDEVAVDTDTFDLPLYLLMMCH